MKKVISPFSKAMMMNMIKSNTFNPHKCFAKFIVIEYCPRYYFSQNGKDQNGFKGGVNSDNQSDSKNIAQGRLEKQHQHNQPPPQKIAAQLKQLKSEMEKKQLQSKLEIQKLLRVQAQKDKAAAEEKARILEQASKEKAEAEEKSRILEQASKDKAAAEEKARILEQASKDKKGYWKGVRKQFFKFLAYSLGMITLGYVGLCFNEYFYPTALALKIISIKATFRRLLICKRFGSQSLEEQKDFFKIYYTPGNSTEQQLDYILANLNRDIITVVSGLAGIGKSTSLKYLLIQRRKGIKTQLQMNAKGKDASKQKNFYYINLKCSELQKPQKSQQEKVKERVDQMFDLLDSAMNLADQDNQAVVVIDDINKIEQLENSKLLVNKISEYTHRHVKICLISSSDEFEKNQINYKQLSKEGCFKMIQLKNSQQMANAIEKIVLKLKATEQYKEKLSKFGPQEIKYFINQGHSLRVAKNCLMKAVDIMVNQPNLTLLNAMKKSDDNERALINASIQNLLQPHAYFKRLPYAKLILQEFVNLGIPQKISLQNCYTAQQAIRKRILKKHQIEKTGGLDDPEQEFLSGLNKANLLIYCLPRSQFIVDQFKQISKTL